MARGFPTDNSLSMAIPYRLMLVSPNLPNRAERITRSTQAIGWGLWNYFLKLPHVTLFYNDSRRPIDNKIPVDFTLIHCCTDDYILKNINDAKLLTSKKIMYIMEAIRKNDTVDKNFCFLPNPNAERQGYAPVEKIDFPYINELVGTKNEKILGSILIDHPYPKIAEELMWSDKILEWLEPLRGKVKISQMVVKRFGMPEPPGWVETIPEMSYTQYLEKTSGYENYIMTHPESFGHSITDMVVRGTRVLVPVVNGKTFAKPYIVNTLRLPTFGNRDELMSALASPLDNFDRKKICTDMPDVVARIDAYCQSILEANQK